MATKKIILEFLGQPSDGDRFRFKIYINQAIYQQGGRNIDITYKNGSDNPPSSIGIGTDLNDTIQKTVDFLNEIWTVGTTAGGYLTSMSYTRVGNKIEMLITSTAPANLITRWEMRTSGPFRFITATPCETIFLTNYNALDSISSSNLRIYNLDIPTSRTIGTPNRFDVELERGFRYKIQSTTTFVDLIWWSTPLSVNPDNVTVIVNSTTISISPNVNVVDFGNTYPMDQLYYSLDGETWQSNNTFNDITDGNYTLYIRDNYGCIKSLEFTVSNETNVNTAPPYTYISESNSLRFVKRVDWGNCSNYKNVFNTLSFEENTKPANKFIQKFQSCDTIVTQVKTSYENLEIYAGETEITPTKIVRNIGISDKRDCLYFNDGTNLSLLFLSGNVYEYDTDDVVSTYDLNGALPDWGVVGNFVETTYGILQIIGIGFNDDGNRYLILNSNQPIVTPITDTVQLIYNRDSYDIWEFTIPMNDFLNETFKIGIRFHQTEPDEDWPDVFWISECISVRERWPYSKKIVWRNSKNTDIYFFSGIEMMARLDFCQVESNLSDGDVEIQKTDSQVLTIENTDYKAVQLNIQYLTTGMIRKLKLAVKHDYLVIEDVPYVLAESPEITNLAPSNFYTFTAKLLEAGDIFNTGTANTQTIVTQGELIGLQSGDDTNEYLRIL